MLQLYVEFNDSIRFIHPVPDSWNEDEDVDIVGIRMRMLRHEKQNE